MTRKCANCRLVNFAGADVCLRCGTELTGTRDVDTASRKPRRGILLRSVVCFAVCVAMILLFYLSLLASAASLSIDEKSKVREAIGVLKEHGFEHEAFLLENVTAFKADDNWLNASVAKENAYAATNFPFEIVTLYPDFFTYPVDATERAAILLHESKHLEAASEHDAYEFVWKNRKQLGWTRDKYINSPVWRNIRRQTRDAVGELFTCDLHEFGDCTD
jgi:hypothetical protein